MASVGTCINGSSAPGTVVVVVAEGEKRERSEGVRWHARVPCEALPLHVEDEAACGGRETTEGLSLLSRVDFRYDCAPWSPTVWVVHHRRWRAGARGREKDRDGGRGGTCRVDLVPYRNGLHEYVSEYHVFTSVSAATFPRSFVVGGDGVGGGGVIASSPPFACRARTRAPLISF